MIQGTRTPPSGQGTTPSPTAPEHVQRARIQHELAQLPAEARALLTRTHVASAALAAVAVAVTLVIGSQGWIEARLIAAYPFAVGYLLSLGATPEDALELAQASIVAALGKAGTFDASRETKGDPVRAWFCGFLMNSWRGRVQRRARSEVPLDHASQGALAISDHEGRVEARKLLRALRRATTAARWRAWWSNEVDRESAAEIAAREKVSAGKIEWRIRCARKDLDRVLRAFGTTLTSGPRKGGA